MSLKLNSSGGGSVTLQEPSTANNQTLTLPAVTGTVLTTATAGVVLQVVNVATSSSASTTSTSYTAATGLTASITPSSASNKILVIFSMQYFLTAAANVSMLRLYRNGSSIKAFEYTAYAGTSTHMASPTCIYLDSPASTSSVTYAVFFNSVLGSNVIYNYTDATGTPTSTITLMEIAA